MRSRTIFVFIWLAGATWLGCNALLGIETAVFDPDGGVPPEGRDGGEDGATGRDARPDIDARADAGPCIDTMTNPNHCGACDHSCFGGACASGMCAPVLLAADGNGPLVVAIDSTHVYWTNVTSNRVSRVAKVGGAVAVLFASPNPLGAGLEVVAGEVYFSVIGATVATSGVFRCPATGCVDPPTAVVVGEAPAFRIAGGVLTFAGQGSGEVGRCTLPCAGAPEVIASAEKNPWSVAGSADLVLWANLFPPALRARVNGSPSVTLSTATVGDIVIDNGFIVYAELGVGPRVSLLDGGASRRVYPDALNSAHLVVFGGRVFFGDTSRGRRAGRIFDCPLTGCPSNTQALADGQDVPQGIAVEEKSVYWANSSDADAGAIMRLAR